MRYQKIYLRFLSLIQAVQAKGELPTLDPEAKQLIEIIAVRHSLGQAMTISDAMGLKSIASPATLHRKIDILRGLGLIETHFQGDNRRTKYLRPTELAADYFSTMGSMMENASTTAD
jgi:DNA-binding MarR family transcriptional regulator